MSSLTVVINTENNKNKFCCGSLGLQAADIKIYAWRNNNPKAKHSCKTPQKGLIWPCTEMLYHPICQMAGCSLAEARWRGTYPTAIHKLHLKQPQRNFDKKGGKVMPFCPATTANFQPQRKLWVVLQH